ncbi:hypothetical protein [Halorubrum aethiopicum]|uniref:hypothetical protein n=1 Tax=Halorubrum aethiopicum TaxID=1758255 RepID=UPI000830B3D4|nr:hypothetical protein [Halorubrum aethiopicum]
MKRRRFILLCGGASSGALSVGTGAFSSMEAERGVSVDIVSDEQAFVGYDTPNDGTTVTDGSEITLVRVENRFNENISIVDVTVGEGKDVLGEVSYTQDEIGTGDHLAIKAPVTGIAPGDHADIEITVTVEGSGVTAQLFGDTETRRFSIKREEDDDGDGEEGDGEEGDGEEAISGSSSPVDFSGGGNAEILGEDRMETVDVYLLGSERGGGNEVTVREGVEINTKQKIRGQLGSGDTIVGITLNGTVYVHPQWSAEQCDLDQPNNGGPGQEQDDPPSCETD